MDKLDDAFLYSEAIDVTTHQKRTSTVLEVRPRLG